METTNTTKVAFPFESQIYSAPKRTGLNMLANEQERQSARELARQGK
jgi:hypothetical protein